MTNHDKNIYLEKSNTSFKNQTKSPFLNHSQQIEEEQNSFKRTLAIMIITFVAIIFTILIFADYEEFSQKHFGEDSKITHFFEKHSQKNVKKEKADFALPFGLKRQNILFLAVDASNSPDDLWTGTRTDTMILLNVDPKSKSVNALSIPRDSKIYLPENNGVNKINSAHAIGGIDMAIEAVEDTFGVKIDRYVMVHSDAVKEMVDAIGGIDMYIEKPMRYHDYTDNLHINLNIGDQHLDGDKAVKYLRFRHDNLGDIGRTHRQQWFIRSLINELKKPKTITKIPDMINVANKYIKTNMSVHEISQYAAFAKNIDMNKIEVAMLPGAPNQKGAISYWILDPEKTQQVINRVIYRDKAQENQLTPHEISVLYTSEKKQEANELMETLKENGVVIKCSEQVSVAHSHFTAHSPRTTIEYFNHAKKTIPQYTNMQFIYDPNGFYCADTDYTVVLAGK
ncbi:MAG: LCP family protein [Candidatus Gastranaerophilales bacterium]